MTRNYQQLQRFAYQILSTKNFDEKLTGFSTFIAGNPDLIVPDFIPANPGRPAGLEIDTHPKGKPNYYFPKKASLEYDKSRGMVLHFFANHELLAIELMALAVLRFPDAPMSFLNGIVETIHEEQDHMRLYISRMNELGVEFGEVPLNGFFWKSLREIQTPAEYVAGMSLTFEQANLDFSRYYETNFSDLGDLKTAEILQRVRLDEIGHVKFGAKWLGRWKNQNQSLWQAYLENIRFPMTPMRGKGLVFDKESRELSELDSDFINQMNLYSSSKGRPPRLFWFNPTCEHEIGLKSMVESPPKAMRELSEDLSVLMMYLALADDVVAIHELPTTNWLTKMKEAGFDIPELIASLQQPSKAVTGRKIAQPTPWGWSPSAVKKLEPTFSSVVKGYKIPPTQLWQNPDPLSNIFSKAYASSLRGSSDLPSLIVRKPEDIGILKPKVEILSENLVLKSIYGSSGRNFQFIKSGEELSSSQLNWLEKELQSHQMVLLEPWVNRIADLSVQFEVSSEGKIQILGMTRFLVNSRGQYRGHLLGKTLDGLPQQISKLWHDSTHSWETRFLDSAHRVGRKLFEQAYFGPVGIDGFIYESQGEFLFQSLSEINPRYTMGRVSLELAKHLPAKSPAYWLHVSQKQINQLGFASFVEFCDSLSKTDPLDIKTLKSGVKLIEKGVLPTNDPAIARQALSILIKYPSNELQRLLASENLL